MIDLSTVINTQRSLLVWKVLLIDLICLQWLIQVVRLHLVEARRLHDLVAFPPRDDNPVFVVQGVRRLWIIDVHFIVLLQHLLFAFRQHILMHLILRVLIDNKLGFAHLHRCFPSGSLPIRKTSLSRVIRLVLGSHSDIVVRAH